MKIVMLPIDETIAETILKMEDVCHSEGIGPDASQILEFIRTHFPDLAQKYSHLYKTTN